MCPALSISPSCIFLLSPCSIDPWPHARSECACVNTKLLAILCLLTVWVCLQSAALQPFMPEFLTNHNTSSCHILLFRSHKLRHWNGKGIVYSHVLRIFKTAFSRLYKFEELFKIICLNSIALKKHITSSAVVWMEKWRDVADWLSMDITGFQWMTQLISIIYIHFRRCME